MEREERQGREWGGREGERERDRVTGCSRICVATCKNGKMNYFGRWAVLRINFLRLILETKISSLAEKKCPRSRKDLPGQLSPPLPAPSSYYPRTRWRANRAASGFLPRQRRRYLRLWGRYRRWRYPPARWWPAQRRRSWSRRRSLAPSAWVRRGWRWPSSTASARGCRRSVPRTMEGDEGMVS